MYNVGSAGLCVCLLQYVERKQFTQRRHVCREDAVYRSLPPICPGGEQQYATLSSHFRATLLRATPSSATPRTPHHPSPQLHYPLQQHYRSYQHSLPHIRLVEKMLFILCGTRSAFLVVFTIFSAYQKAAAKVQTRDGYRQMVVLLTVSCSQHVHILYTLYITVH